LFWALPGPIGWRAFGLLGIGFFPPGFCLLPMVYKDPLMHGALLLGVGCVALPTRRALPARLVASGLCFLLATGVRHNAAAAVWPFLALPFMRLQVLARLRRSFRLVVASIAGLVLAFAMTWGAERALAPLSRKTEFWQTVPVYDLAGMSLRAGELLVEPDSPVFASGMGLAEIQRLFRVNFGNALYWCVPVSGRGCVHLFKLTRDRHELEQLSRNWLSAIAEHPAAYLEHRWKLAREMLTVNTSGWDIYALDGAPHGPFAKQYPPTERLLRILSFFERHIWSVVYSPWVYVILSLLLLPVTLRRYLRTGAPLPLLFVLSGSAYLLSNLVGAIASDYRYSVWTILCTLLALFMIATHGIGALRLHRFFRS
jgi:hypothetical protein